MDYVDSTSKVGSQTERYKDNSTHTPQSVYEKTFIQLREL